uniref:Uncharacterized protein n=1 Tax=Kalanchoe fedtschenkoi TaxID=63787 RepID=A0A7N0V0X1_KALFE
MMRSLPLITQLQISPQRRVTGALLQLTFPGPRLHLLPVKSQWLKKNAMQYQLQLLLMSYPRFWPPTRNMRPRCRRKL